MSKRPLFIGLSTLALLLGVPCLRPSVQAAPLPASLDVLREKARDCEEKGQWADGCRLYDEILKKDRSYLEAKEGYQRCLRHIMQARRHRDATFQKVLLSLKPLQAAEVYEDVLTKLRTHYVEPGSVNFTRLFQQGLQELAFALEDETFIRKHLVQARREQIEAFRARLGEWRDRSLSTTQEALDQVLAVALEARRSLGLAPAVVVLEFACGACNGLDEHTSYLTPGHLLDIQASLKGELVGIGIQLAVIDQKVFISQVLPESDALAKRLRLGDRVVQIDQQPVDPLTPDATAARLQGEVGSMVELVVIPLGEAAPRTVKVQRRPILIRSVEFDLLEEEDGTRVGVVRILTFHNNTVQEVRDALVQLQSMAAAVLILDLRGNPGGLFRPAVQVAELFLAEGVIVLTQSQLPRYNHSYRADNPSAVDLPLVVLVDGDTASAAEVLAGALKENQRATLVGQTTFGKGLIQAVLPLEKIPAGIRITVAKFYSPTNYAYAGRGVAPDEMVEAGPEAQLSVARQLAVRLARMMGR